MDDLNSRIRRMISDFLGADLNDLPGGEDLAVKDFVAAAAKNGLSITVNEKAASSGEAEAA